MAEAGKMRDFYIRVACAVLKMAVSDARNKSPYKSYPARYWLKTCGYEWLDLLGIDPYMVDGAIMERR